MGTQTLVEGTRCPPVMIFKRPRSTCSEAWKSAIQPMVSWSSAMTMVVVRSRDDGVDESE